MAEVDQVTLTVILAVLALAVILFFETRFLRKRIKNRRLRTVKGDSELPDDAYNAIITTKAIVSSLERQGVRSEEASAWLRDAEAAHGRSNYRVALELTGRAKERLLSVKADQAARGDLAKLEQLSTAGGSSEEVTTKELLQKEMPPNLLQSKFSIEVAGTAVESGRLAGRDVLQAAEFLEAARERFHAKDYTAALAIARQSKRAAEGLKIETPVSVPAVATASQVAPGRACPSCGALIQSDDVFCRKCGTRLPPATCASCGASLLSDDAFCRKCGARVSR